MSDGLPSDDAGAHRLQVELLPCLGSVLEWESQTAGLGMHSGREIWGFPMVDGPNGPERDPDVQEENLGRMGRVCVYEMSENK